MLWSLCTVRDHSARALASSRVTCFIVRAYTGTMCKLQPTQEKSGDILEKFLIKHA